MIERIAFLSMHTSPLLQPGVGYAGGMNVYIDQLSRAMAAAGRKVKVFTRRDDPDVPASVTVVPGYEVIHVDAGPPRPLPLDRLPALVSRYAVGASDEVARVGVDVIHTHYWLSGWAGLVVKRRLGLPMANSFHTLGRIKDLTRRGDEPPESLLRIAAETEVIQTSDCVVASTPVEADELLTHYGADPGALCVSPPGVDHDQFYPGSRDDARRRLGLGDGPLIVHVGRIQALKGTDVLLAAFERVRRQLPGATLLMVGGPSGPRGERELRALKARAARLDGSVLFSGPLPHRTVADVYRAADVLHVPSRSESFGLVAVEAQACGTPVVASRVGGLTVAIDDGASGILVDGWDPDDHAEALLAVLNDSGRRAQMSVRASEWAEGFSWTNTASRFLELYDGISASHV